MKDLKWHGHRGCRGLLPENSIPAFIRAAEIGVDYLEMDVVISRDNEVVIAHEPFMPALICQHPDGSAISEEEEKSLNLYQMDYVEISRYNCGVKHPGFSEQESLSVHRPSLDELVKTIEGENSFNSIGYTIELKSSIATDDLYHPRPSKYVELVLETINRYGVIDKCILQAFDTRILEEVKRQSPNAKTSYLFTDKIDLKSNMEAFSFLPEMIGPNYTLVDNEMMSVADSLKIEVHPWTVNEVVDMQKMIDMGVHGIITDYPNRKALFGG